MPRFSSPACVENSRDARHNRERKNIVKEPGCKQKSIPVDLVQEKREKKPASLKWVLINPIGPRLKVVDVCAETTVEGRDIRMVGPVKSNNTPFKVVPLEILAT